MAGALPTQCRPLLVSHRAYLAAPVQTLAYVVLVKNPHEVLIGYKG